MKGFVHCDLGTGLAECARDLKVLGSSFDKEPLGMWGHLIKTWCAVLQAYG
jgi:hypothetical protein